MACESYIKQNNSIDRLSKKEEINLSVYQTNIELLEITNQILKTIRIMFFMNIFNKEKLNKLKDIYEVQKNNKKKLILEINAFREGAL